LHCHNCYDSRRDENLPGRKRKWRKSRKIELRSDGPGRRAQLLPVLQGRMVKEWKSMYLRSPRKPRIYIGRIPKGYAGTRTTCDYIIQLIKEGAKDFWVRQHAIDILIENGVRSKDYLAEIKTLFEWVKRNIRYTRDIHRVELLHSARRMLELQAGDCDDMTILLASMIKSIGHPVRLVLVGFNPLKKKLFSHIYLEAFCKGLWIPMDATMNRPMGWAPPADHHEIVEVQ
jgi:transglutaminase-like putative cysteine protease